MLNEELKQQMIEMINAQVQADFIILFGSFAKGTARIDNDIDIDIAYFSSQKLSSYEPLRLLVT